MPKINVYNAKRYVICVDTQIGKVKLFQITFSSRDGSIYVTFPYLKACGGRVGVISLPKGGKYFKKFSVGENFRVTANLVKYSHHPSGQAHFSLTGKVKTEVKKESVKLSEINGHIFTTHLQGLNHFTKLEEGKKATASRGIVPFPFGKEKIEAIKFICYLYSETELGKRVHHSGSSPWGKLYLPDKRSGYCIPLATPIVNNGEKQYLLLVAEKTGPVFTNNDKGISFIGGFDPEDDVLNYSLDTSFLMMFIHEMDNFDELVKKFDTIDL